MGLISEPTPTRRSDFRGPRETIDFERIVLRNSLRIVHQACLHVVEPSTVYLENWHIDLIAEYPPFNSPHLSICISSK
jgi:hypothetical protein